MLGKEPQLYLLLALFAFFCAAPSLVILPAHRLVKILTNILYNRKEFVRAHVSTQRIDGISLGVKKYNCRIAPNSKSASESYFGICGVFINYFRTIFSVEFDDDIPLAEIASDLFISVDVFIKSL